MRDDVCVIADEIAGPPGRSGTTGLSSNEQQVDDVVNEGLVLHEAGDLMAAQGKYRWALDLDSRHSVAHYNLGVVLEDLGRKAEALEEYRRALNCDPDDTDARFNHDRIAPCRWKPPQPALLETEPEPQPAPATLPVSPPAPSPPGKGEEDRPSPALAPLLELAVPMWIERFRPMTWEERIKVRDEALGIIGCDTDAESIACLVAGGPAKPGRVAAAFNAIAKALALGALQPGGVTFAGMHFEAKPFRRMTEEERRMLPLRLPVIGPRCEACKRWATWDMIVPAGLR
jgi:tetratricopeptide (TPR) repeat protein